MSDIDTYRESNSTPVKYTPGPLDNFKHNIWINRYYFLIPPSIISFFYCATKSSMLVPVVGFSIIAFAILYILYSFLIHFLIKMTDVPYDTYSFESKEYKMEMFDKANKRYKHLSTKFKTFAYYFLYIYN